MDEKSKGSINGNINQTSEKSADEDRDLRCGIKSCKPSWLQIFNNSKAFLAWLCCFAFVQGFIVNGINNVNTTTMERRFNLPSSQVGLISSAYDVSAGLLVLPITYFGNFGHQPRIIGVGAFILAIGSLTMTLPHFTTGPYEMGSSISDNCIVQKNTTVAECTAEQSGLSSYLYVFMLGQFLHGVGGSILYSLGFVFIDGNVKISSSPMYQGILSGAAALGPALGFLAGGQILNTMYVDFDTRGSSSVGITPADPRWVGAWWLGFLISSILGFLVTLLFLGYARELPQAAEARATRESQAHQNGAEAVTSREGFGRSIKDMPTAAKYILMNPTFVFVALASVTEGILVAGCATFLSKFIQNQFDLSAGTAAIYGGMLIVPGAAGGQVIGGVIVRCADMKVRGMLRMCVVLCVIAAVGCLSMLTNCGTTDIAGVFRAYENRSIAITTPTLNSVCNENCSCSALTYEPVCGVNNRQYFSPCHAGCADTVILSGNAKSFGNCSCVEASSVTNSSFIQANAGPCDSACGALLPVFMLATFVMILLTFMASVPTLNVTLRCVPDSQRAFAIGIEWVFVRFLGTVPGPVIYGTAVDSACTLWQTTCSGDRGSCWVYDSFLLSRNMTIVSLCAKLLSALFFWLAVMLYKSPATSSECAISVVEIKKVDGNASDGISGIDNPAVELDSVDVVERH